MFQVIDFTTLCGFPAKMFGSQAVPVTVQDATHLLLRLLKVDPRWSQALQSVKADAQSWRQLDEDQTTADLFPKTTNHLVVQKMIYNCFYYVAIYLDFPRNAGFASSTGPGFESRSGPHTAGSGTGCGVLKQMQGNAQIGIKTTRLTEVTCSKGTKVAFCKSEVYQEHHSFQFAYLVCRFVALLYVDWNPQMTQSGDKSPSQHWYS